MGFVALYFINLRMQATISEYKEFTWTMDLEDVITRPVPNQKYTNVIKWIYYLFMMYFYHDDCQPVYNLTTHCHSEDSHTCHA